MVGRDLAGILTPEQRQETLYNKAWEAAAKRVQDALSPPEQILPADWLEKFYYIPRPRDPVTGDVLDPGPIRLADHQRAIVNEALSHKPDGTFKYVTVIYSAPKKSGKSGISAGVIKYMGHTYDYGNIYCLANDGKQSSDRLYGPVYKSYQIHRRLGGPFSNVHPNLTEVTLPNHTKIEAIPCDAAGEAGAEPLLSAWSELWGFDTESKRRLFTEMTIPSTMWGYALRWVESYAGFKGQSELLWELYELGAKEGTPHPDFDYLKGRDGEPVVWVNEAAGIFCYWDTVPRMVWQNDDYYQSESKILSVSEFKRVHQNQWVSPVGSFIDGSSWDACADSSVPPLLQGSKVPVVVAIDASISGACTSILAVTRDPQYPETDVAVRAVKIFRPENGVVNLQNTIGHTLRQWAEWWNIVCVVYDPYQMENMIQNYRQGNVVLEPHEVEGMDHDELSEYMQTQRNAVQLWYFSFDQQNLRAKADKRLQDMIIAKQVHYNSNDRNWPIVEVGNEESLTKHIKQAGAKESGDNKIRIEQLSRTSYVDAAVCLSMAAAKCLDLNLENREFDINDAALRLARGEITYDDWQGIMRNRRVRVRDGN